MSMFMPKRIKWGWGIVISILFLQLAVFIFFGEDSYIGIHDNLDIHIVDQRILQLQDAFFAQDAKLPLLGGIDRAYLASEFNLYTILYMIFPTFIAYIIGHFLKILIALVSVILLAKDIFKERYTKYENIIVVVGFTYGLLPLYPAFSLSFASLPLLIFLLRKIIYSHKKRYYIALFLYPIVSYFTFFGIFILGYLSIYMLYKMIREKRIPLTIIAAMIVLSFGYILCEYRLFGLMLFGQAESIRETMIMSTGTLRDMFLHFKEAFVDGVFHADSLHTIFLMPLCVIYFIYCNIQYIKAKEYRKIMTDTFNLLFGFLILNAAIYMLYYWEGFRVLIETIVPPLKGWQFTRTVFFNPFLWYACLLVIGKRLYDAKHKKIANVIVVLAMLVVLGSQTLYNDFYNTVYTHAYMILKGKDTDSLSYREFYSEALFEKIKAEINYKNEMSVAYGMHPAVLQYNGIETLDGCLSYYEQEYKEKFRQIITPALDKSEVGRVYFDDWGARAYVFSGTDDGIWKPVKKMTITDYELLIDVKAFQNMGGVYVFSRIPISNAEKLTLKLVGTYKEENSPYTMHVYR